MISGIYFYRNKINNMMYIGQSKNVCNRIRIHNFRLVKGCDACTRLQNAVSKYGLESFESGILEHCDLCKLDERECFWIDHLNTLSPYGYNLRSGGSNGSHNEETKQHLSQIFMGENSSFYGRHHTKESIEKIKLGRIGKKSLNALSKYYGITRVSRPNKIKWQAAVRSNNKVIYIGIYDNEITAAKMYDKFILENDLNRPTNFSGDVYV